MTIKTFSDKFKIELPFAKNGVFWNGKPDEFNNIGYGLNYSQEFGETPFAKTGVYGSLRGHSGLDFGGAISTPIVAPCDCYVTYVGYSASNKKGEDPNGYGNFIFFETKTEKINGDYVKMQFVIAHLSKCAAKMFKWYKAGEVLGYMGSTGMSTGSHLHFGGRPIRMYGSNEQRVFGDNGYLGYVDLIDFFLTKPVYDKAVLYKQDMMKLIRLKGDSNIYAIDKKGRANLLINWDTYKRGLEMELWEDKTEEVEKLPAQGSMIIFINDK